MDLRNFDLPRYLSVLPLFDDMRPVELQRLSVGCRLVRVPRGDTVCRVGAPCEEFHVIVVGQVKLFMTSATGQEKVLQLVGPGNTFGEALMFSGRPYVVDVQTLEDSLLIVVSKQAVLREVEQDPRFALRMLAGMSRRLHGLIRDVEAYTLKSGMQRVIGYLLHDCQQDISSDGVSVTVSLPATKATIASRLSLTPEYFSRVLHELSSAGLIEVDRRDVRIPDAGRLAQYQMP
jgi:CRP-like cAMP-binding protein